MFVKSEIESQCEESSRFAYLVVLNRPRQIKLEVIAEHHCAHAKAVAIKPWIEIVLDLRTERAILNHFIAHTIFAGEWRFARPACAHIIKCSELKISEKV